MEVRELTGGDVDALRAYLLRDPCRHAYLLGTLHWFGITGPRARFLGAFADGALVGALAEGAEVHCWYASVGADGPPAARALAREMSPRVSVLLGPEDLTTAVLDGVPAARHRGAARMVFSTLERHEEDYPAPAHPARRARVPDVPTLVDLYEGYEMDGYPTRRHLYRALVERIRWTAVLLVEQDGRPVAAERIDAGSPEVWVIGGLTTDPAHRGRGLGMSARLATFREAKRLGVRTVGLRDPRNPFHRKSFQRPTGWWIIASLKTPRPPRWRQLAGRALARVSPWDRPCRRRRMTYLDAPEPPEQRDVAEVRARLRARGDTPARSPGTDPDTR